jgi:hypothetical protein
MLPRVKLYERALSPALFARLRRGVGRLGTERLAQTYQTTFWFDFQAPSSWAEVAILQLRRWMPATRGIHGAEWWLSRMHATDVQVDFHRDRDERLALSGGREVHPTWSSVLFLNRVRGGALAVTAEAPCDDRPARAPERLDLDLVAPRANRFAVFDGALTHGVLDANNQIPTRRLRGPARLRLALIVNWWARRPTDVPRFREVEVYAALATRSGSAGRSPGGRARR